MMMALPTYSTLADLYPLLQGKKGERDHFIAKLLDKMAKAGQGHGPVTMRVGITGNGSRPSFRIDRVGAPPIAFDANFNQFTDTELSDNAWSAQAWGCAEVTAFLAKIRNITLKAT